MVLSKHYMFLQSCLETFVIHQPPKADYKNKSLVCNRRLIPNIKPKEIMIGVRYGNNIQHPNLKSNTRSKMWPDV